MNPTPETLLAARKPEALRTYLKKVGSAAVPDGVKIPTNPREAMLLGMALARKTAYEDGLVDGVSLGIEVVVSSFGD